MPRVAELFEARKPKEQAIISEIDGVVRFAGFQRGARKVVVTSDSGEEREYLIPRGKYVNVHEGDRVRAGEPLMDGAANPHDILDILGEKELQKYLVNEIQEVYRLQGVQINDKHIEVIVKQMLKRVVVEEPGDTDFLVGEQVAKTIFARRNQAVIRDGGTPARGKPILIGYYKILFQHRELYFCCLIPGNDTRIDPSSCRGHGRSFTRPERECDYGTHYPCWNRDCAVYRRPR